MIIWAGIPHYIFSNNPSWLEDFDSCKLTSLAGHSGGCPRPRWLCEFRLYHLAEAHSSAFVLRNHNDFHPRINTLPDLTQQKRRFGVELFMILGGAVAGFHGRVHLHKLETSIHVYIYITPVPNTLITATAPQEHAVISTLWREKQE